MLKRYRDPRPGEPILQWMKENLQSCIRSIQGGGKAQVDQTSDQALVYMDPFQLLGLGGRIYVLAGLSANTGATGSWTVPQGTDVIRAIAVGGGGGGGGKETNETTVVLTDETLYIGRAGGSGGAGGSTVIGLFRGIPAGWSFNLSVGDGGAGGAVGSDGTIGGNSTISLLDASGQTTSFTFGAWGGGGGASPNEVAGTPEFGGASTALPITATIAELATDEDIVDSQYPTIKARYFGIRGGTGHSGMTGGLRKSAGAGDGDQTSGGVPWFAICRPDTGQTIGVGGAGGGRSIGAGNQGSAGACVIIY